MKKLGKILLVVLALVAVLVGLVFWGTRGLPEAAPAAVSAPAPAGGESKNIIFILDASGSMASVIDNRMKMAIAEDVMIGLIRDLPGA